jgi:3-keto-5-aminohexanoate cleavage enzyme
VVVPEPLIINLAPTGMVPTKETTPYVPLTCDEVLEDAAAAHELGASIIHLHARDETGRPTHRAEAFAPMVEGIRAIDPELVVCVTCSGRLVADLSARAEVLGLTGKAKPDMASLTLGSNNFTREASVNAPDVIRGLAGEMRAQGIKPELEAFEPGMVALGSRLVKEGLLDSPCYLNILLGNLGTSPLEPGVLAAFLGLVPDGWVWALAGLGRYQLDANLLAIATGGHVRVGIEDNVWFDRGRTRLATNRDLVERLAAAAELAERPIATPRETRALLGLAPVESVLA